MAQPKDDLSRSLVVLEQDKTLISVVELSLSTWLVGGFVPGVERDLESDRPSQWVLTFTAPCKVARDLFGEPTPLAGGLRRAGPKYFSVSD